MRTSKVTIDDLDASKRFYEELLGMTGLDRFVAEGSLVEPGRRIQTETFDEVFFDFDGGMFVALFEPNDQEPLPKSAQPVVAIYSSDFDAVLERVKAADRPGVRRRDVPGQRPLWKRGRPGSDLVARRP